MQVDIAEFRYANVPAASFTLVIAKRKSGKTTWTKFIAGQMPSSQQGITCVMAGSIETKRQWCSVVHPLFVHDASIDKLEQIIKTQNDRVEYCRRKRVPFDEDNSHVTLIMDDCCAFSKLMKSDAFIYIASNGRHLHLTVFVLCQYLNQIPAQVRVQFDYVIVLATGNRKNITKIQEEYSS